MYRIEVTGNIGKNNAQLKTVNNEGDRPYSVANFWMAHNRKTSSGKKETSWISVAVFYKYAETVAPMLTAGRKVCVVGRPVAKFYTKDGVIVPYTQIIAEEVELLDPPKKDEPEVTVEVTADPEELPFD